MRLKMKKLLIDSRVRKVEYEYLSKYFDVIKIPLSNDVYEEISGHSDIFYCRLHDKIICAPNAPIIEKEIEDEKIYAYYNSNLAGFATIWEGDEIFLHFLFIKKSERRKRIGTALIKALLDYYKKPIKLKCLIKNKNAIAFYKRVGAKECSYGESIDGPYVLLSIEKILDPTL